MSSARYRKARAAYEAEIKAVQEASGCTTRPEPYDLTGGFVFDGCCWRLLKNPTPTVAAEIYEDLLIHGREAGWECDSRTFEFSGEDQS